MADLGVSPDVEIASGSPRSSPAEWRGRGDVLPGLGVVAAVAAVATVIAARSDALSPLVVGTVLGAVVANVVAVPDVVTPGVRFAGRSVLRIGIVLLGLRLAIGDLASLGVRGILVVAVVVVATFTGTCWCARRMGLPDDFGLLVATGYSICGASAIAAMDGVVEAEEEQAAYAIALVTLCGTLSIVVLPALADPLGFAGEVFGAWVGGAVHDVGQVVATAATDGDEAIAAATVVKLTRVVLLAPLVAAVAIARRRRSARPPAPGASTKRPPLVPLFVVGFLAAIVVRTTGVLPTSAIGTAAEVEKVLLTIALVGLGMSVDVSALRRLGPRPLLLGLVAWILVAGTAAIGTSLAL
jgi:uncharacterized integral membrane protein (TIGR00698 family)